MCNKRIGKGGRARRFWLIDNFLALCLLGVICHPAAAELDLHNATVSTLENGLTVILLEDRNFPVASVQMLYRVGARNEITGETGIAHFLEHMAFRDSTNFPDTDVVSSIYAMGGEWHGYTWLDQTTYFATVPKDQLDLLLRIEADRMTSLLISPEDMDAERGAVLAEMHSYENSPSSMLIDAVMYVSFLAHPYRNNTIGWASDIENLSRDSVVNFYKQHYHPANAVLAVVGDIDSEKTRERIDALFGPIAHQPRTPLPHTIEPLQHGERRVMLYAKTDARQFSLAYRAPSIHNPDFAAFLVLQELLGTGSGINFLQNDWGTAVEDGDILSGAAQDLTTWFAPHEQDFLFVINGSAGEGVAEAEVLQSIEGRIATVRENPPSTAAITAAIDSAMEHLAFDIQTTEDAAHQLAFFAGIDALDLLLNISNAIHAVRAEDVQDVAARYLLPERRTIAWHVPAMPDTEPRSVLRTAGTPSPEKSIPVAPTDTVPALAPVVQALRGGITAIVQSSDLSPTAQVLIVLPGRFSALAEVDTPVVAHSALSYALRPAELSKTLALANNEIATLDDGDISTGTAALDPTARLEQIFADIMAPANPVASPVPTLIVVAGDVVTEDAFRMLEQQFGNLAAAAASSMKPKPFLAGQQTVNIGRPLAQAQLGYIAPAPGPTEPGFDASRLLLYILSHAYEGRLGKEAISRRGLAYYIDSRYRSDGQNAWATLSVGVDPGKIDALTDLLRQELARLTDEPPTETEIEDARRHFVGRGKSAAQSNPELADQIAEQWLLFGELITPEQLDKRLESVSYEDVMRAIKPLQQGKIIAVRE